MKKILACIFAFALMLSLAACGAKEAVQDAVRDVLDETSAPAGSSEPAASTPAAPSSEAAPAGGAAMESLIDWMRGGTFSYDFTLTSEYEGQRTEGSGSMAMDGGNMAMAMEQTVEGATTQSRILILEGETYIIDDASKLIMKMGAASPEFTGGVPTDYGDIELVGTGEGEVNGRTLPYEEYTAEGVSVKYYMDGGAVYAIESNYEGAYSLMIITNASGTVPAGAFDMPEGYMEMAL